ncbi:hypothetical protein BGZ95_009167 [Linnemannia exigua]|uniref:Uncharacterized protein n=1 Tax=Linnemannia exigua TaxID=604196 RepID=A0AAD4H834_9FUNG|nr:hypothetical protein BGZ95_009167 [Linnemannia exigua]
MTSTCASSEMADSFEDLSSLSTDKDIESLILATTYDDDDLCGRDNDNTSANKPISQYEDNNDEDIITNKYEVDGTTKTVEEMEDDDFVDIVLGDEEDEAGVLSEGWESSRSESPEPQQGNQRALPFLPDTRPLEDHQGQSSLSQIAPQEDNSTSNNKEDPPAAETVEPHANTASMIPKMRMTKDIFAAALKMPFSPSSPSTPTPSAVLPPPASSPAPKRVIATPSRIRQIRTQPTSSIMGSFFTTPDSGSSSSSSSSSQSRVKMDSSILKRAISVTAHPRLRLIDITSNATPIKANDVPMMTPPLAEAPEQVQVQEDGQEEDSEGICQAIRRSTGKRCTRLGQHSGYCQTHCLLVPK